MSNLLKLYLFFIIVFSSCVDEISDENINIRIYSSKPIVKLKSDSSDSVRIESENIKSQSSKKNRTKKDKSPSKNSNVVQVSPKLEEKIDDNNILISNKLPESNPKPKLKPPSNPYFIKPIKKLETLDTKITSDYIGSIFILNNIYFEGDSEILLKESKLELERLYEFLEQNKNVSIEISGHINYQGYLDPKSLDWKLSDLRAQAVYDFLIKKDIEYYRLSYRGYGNEKMIIPLPKNEGEASMNRRVEIKIVEFKK